jgi:AraC family transcriptional regulator of adaptative response / DNA-3-methyladenine glycosylase II
MSVQKDSSKYAYDFCRKKCHDRDDQYDGTFFSGVSSTGIYCRSTCPAISPLEKNNSFYQNKSQAEKAGLRPCLRCRPELAPDKPIREHAVWHINNTIGRIHNGLFSDNPDRSQIDEFTSIIGVTPTKYWKTYQLGFAKTLLTDTSLSAQEITRITKFDTSKKMLNELFQLYRRDPIKVRKPLKVAVDYGEKSCSLHLFYRPPFDWSVLLDYFAARTIAGVEKVTGDTYYRSFCLNGVQGWFSLQSVQNINALRLDVHTSDLSCLMPLVWRVRQMFDLNADPVKVKELFETDSILGRVWLHHPGIRVPVCWDPFEFTIRAIVGQLISVKTATKLVTNIVEKFAEDLSISTPKGIKKVFPSASALRKIGSQPFGLTKNKIAAIEGFSQMVVDGSIDLEDINNLDIFIQQCKSVRGIGEWTAQSIAMRGMGSKNAFPASDLGIIQAMLSTDSQKRSPAQIKKIAERWYPLRSYAAMLLWTMHST